MSEHTHFENLEHEWDSKLKVNEGVEQCIKSTNSLQVDTTMTSVIFDNNFAVFK